MEVDLERLEDILLCTALVILGASIQWDRYTGVYTDRYPSVNSFPSLNKILISFGSCFFVLEQTSLQVKHLNT